MNAPTTPKTPRRIYLVRHKDTGAERLIRASTAAQARNHAARDTIEVDVASQEQLVALLTGMEPARIEDAAQGDDKADAPSLWPSLPAGVTITLATEPAIAGPAS